MRTRLHQWRPFWSGLTQAPTLLQSTSRMWVSVPRKNQPWRCSSAARRTALATTRYNCVNDRCVGLNATAMPAIVLTWGPPCSPGNTAESILPASALSVVRMQAPRGP
jgi:hypothetical protein